MIDRNYKELRIIRPHSDNTLKIEVTCKTDNISELVQVAKDAFNNQEGFYAVCDGVLYLIDGKNENNYLIARIVNI